MLSGILFKAAVSPCVFVNEGGRSRWTGQQTHAETARYRKNRSTTYSNIVCPEGTHPRTVAPSLEAAVNLENRNQALMVFSGGFFNLIQPFFKGGKGD